MNSLESLVNNLRQAPLSDEDGRWVVHFSPTIIINNTYLIRSLLPPGIVRPTLPRAIQPRTHLFDSGNRPHFTAMYALATGIDRFTIPSPPTTLVESTVQFPRSQSYIRPSYIRPDVFSCYDHSALVIEVCRSPKKKHKQIGQQATALSQALGDCHISQLLACYSENRRHDTLTVTLRLPNY